MFHKRIDCNIGDITEVFDRAKSGRFLLYFDKQQFRQLASKMVRQIPILPSKNILLILLLD